MTGTDTAPAASPTLPTAEEEARFWALLEQAWAGLGPEPAALRRALLDRDPEGVDLDDPYAVDAWLDPLLAALRELGAGLSAPELVAFDRVVERKLYDIDRADIHEVTDGSDDGFLYARGFVVAMGREYYEAVRQNPAMAVLDAECEELCYLFAHLHEKRFGDWPETGSGISRESVSNPAGWPRG
ncbi:DUF4240 domain-containing protein [Plantactinospora endophytica]|uniref:DUF4240 domain-containing protein n=1 Tax=Plantactinospora endophytica TaxID=673535 RepID=A0ABQ4E1A4_9ACTN|nr:DUF4240 domain-containing protein [Plantactinospora endophytica]GIG88112.1 hypothetical protein Pen02_30480 [Plantactinospora endophytica]